MGLSSLTLIHEGIKETKFRVDGVEVVSKRGDWICLINPETKLFYLEMQEWTFTIMAVCFRRYWACQSKSHRSMRALVTAGNRSEDQKIWHLRLLCTASLLERFILYSPFQAHHRGSTLHQLKNNVQLSPMPFPFIPAPSLHLLSTFHGLLVL